jgi:hypothetical protein
LAPAADAAGGGGFFDFEGLALAFDGALTAADGMIDYRKLINQETEICLCRNDAFCWIKKRWGYIGEGK